MDIKKYVGYAIVDDDGFLVDTISFLEDEPHEVLANYVNPLIPSFIKPRWNFIEGVWTEGATREEIDDYYQSPVQEPSELEILKEENQMNAMAIMELAEFFMGGGM